MGVKSGNDIDSAGSKTSRCIKASLRVLCRARDFYVKSMSNYAGRMHYGATALPESFCLNSSRVREDEDLRALMRAISQRRREEERESNARSKGLPKSFSAVGFGRIDEEKPCYFQEDMKVMNSGHVLMRPRSRSCAVNKRTGML